MPGRLKYSVVSEVEERRTLIGLIRALCADYERRKRLVRAGKVSRRVRMEYVYINSRIFDAASEVSGIHLADTFIKEIGDSTGYARSSIDCMSEATYKKYKADITAGIAKKLHLID